MPNALSNTLAMLKVGGKIVQGLPANNWLEHGYYQFSPSLLVGFYSSNGCHVDEATLFFASKNYTMSGCKLVDGFSTCFSLGVDARLYDYENRFNCYSVPILGDYTVIVRVVATKMREVESVQAPLQSYWFDSGSERRWILTVKALGLNQYQQNEIVVWGTGATAGHLLDTLTKCSNFKKSSVLGVVNTYNDSIGQSVNGTFKVMDNSQVWSESVKCIIIAARYHEQEIYEAVCDRANEHGIRLVRLAKHLCL